MIEQSEPADLPVSAAEPGDRATVEHSPSSAIRAFYREPCPHTKGYTIGCRCNAPKTLADITERW